MWEKLPQSESQTESRVCRWAKSYQVGCERWVMLLHSGRTEYHDELSRDQDDAYSTW